MSGRPGSGLSMRGFTRPFDQLSSGHPSSFGVAHARLNTITMNESVAIGDQQALVEYRYCAVPEVLGAGWGGRRPLRQLRQSLQTWRRRFQQPGMHCGRSTSSAVCRWPTAVSPRF